MSIVREQGSEMVKQGKTVEAREDPLFGSCREQLPCVGTVSLGTQAGEEATICRYQVEGRMLKGILLS